MRGKVEKSTDTSFRAITTKEKYLFQADKENTTITCLKQQQKKKVAGEKPQIKKGLCKAALIENEETIHV